MLESNKNSMQNLSEPENEHYRMRWLLLEPRQTTKNQPENNHFVMVIHCHRAYQTNKAILD
jgi:hypothetical protein